jgi:hypothetical protein
MKVIIWIKIGLQVAKLFNFCHGPNKIFSEPILIAEPRRAS